MPESRIPAVFLDWAGTVVDHGSLAPVRALESIFNECGIVPPRPLVRRFMGLAKKDHIRKILEDADIRSQWVMHHGAAPGETDVDTLYRRFEPKMMEALSGYSQVISGVVEAVAQMRARGMKIAGTTGYTRPMLDRLQALAAEQGYHTDQSLAPEDAGGGRPFPWMCYRLGLNLHIYPLHACVKIGDTDSDMAEGRNAGMWTIGVTRTGNAVGLSEADWLHLDNTQQENLLAASAQELRSAGAHYTAESVADVLPLLEEIEDRISRGERPQ